MKILAFNILNALQSIFGKDNIYTNLNSTNNYKFQIVKIRKLFSVQKKRSLQRKVKTIKQELRNTEQEPDILKNLTVLLPFQTGDCPKMTIKISINF